MAGRENRMADLKGMIKRLCTQLEDAGMQANDPNAKETGNSAPEPLDEETSNSKKHSVKTKLKNPS